MTAEDDKIGDVARLGGHARAQSLGQEKRREIARIAARARWEKTEHDDGLPRATHTGVLKIGDAEIPCAVLENGTRLLTQAGFLAALGRSEKPKGRSQQVADGLPPFLATVSLSPLITQEIIDSTVPVQFRTVTGARALGYRADLLPKVCNLFLSARDHGLLTAQQLGLAAKSEILIRALAQVGIVALVDEATGFQEDRDRDELNRLLALYLSEERLAWARRFPEEFYRQLYRLRGWHWPTGGKRTPLVGKLTNSLVYDKLPPGVLTELRSRNPTDPDTNRRRWKHHQFLSEDLGQPDLRDHLLQLVAIMKAAPTWEQFVQMFERAFPGSNPTMDHLDESSA